MTSRAALISVAGALAATGLVLIGARLHGGSVGDPSRVPARNELSGIAGVPFQRVVVDDRAGDVKMVGDIDGDGLSDLVLAGGRDDGLVWYRYPDWHSTKVAIPTVEFTTDGALGDVDDDGDLDVVVPDGPQGDNLLWFENPGPTGDPSDPNAWSRRIVGEIGDWGKDVELSDFDSDGRLDIATRSPGRVLIFFQIAPRAWQEMGLEDLTLGQEGMASGDVDGDGDADLVVRGEWVENPGNDPARDPSAWQVHYIGDADESFKALVADLDQDGRAEIVFSSSEGVADVVRYTPVTADPRGDWRPAIILPGVERAHTLQAADLDADGDVDLVVGQMHTSKERQILALYNVDGKAGRWFVDLVDETGLHNGVAADVGSDGDIDIYGANWLGNPPVRLWSNPLDPPEGALRLDRWTYVPVSEANTRTFGLAFGDVNSDGAIDILSGEAWWRNPGGNMTDPWVRTPLPASVSAIAMLDVDGDTRTDVIAQQGADGKPLNVIWLEAEDAAATRWHTTAIGAVEAASHAEGAQGYWVAQLEPGGRSEIAISSGAGIYYFRVPDQPEAGNWPRVHVAAAPSDEGFAIGDVDRDGLLDIAATGGDTKEVAWYRNPGNGADGWRAYAIGSFDDAVYPDRTEFVDLDGDGRLDVIVSEENGEATDAQVYWWRAPEDPIAGGWTPALIASGASFNSMGTGDMDRDGDLDVVLGEHRGEKGLYVLNNLADGHVSPQLVSLGRESHLGAKPVDLDGDGDLDIVSIAWDTPGRIHLWRNDAIAIGGGV